MNSSKQNSIHNNKDEKNNFVIIHNDVKGFEDKKIKTRQIENTGRFIRSNKIIEYTDDVSEQMRALYTQITINLEEYFKEINDIDEINDKFRQYFDTIKNYCINTGLINDNNEAYKCKLLKDIYRSFRHNAVVVALETNESDAKEFVLEYLKESIKDFGIFYNSDYYYRCEYLREQLIEIAKNLALEEGIKDFETESIDKRKRYIYDYQFNYAWFLKNNINLITEKNMNEALVPPEHIKILYKRTQSDTPKGILLMKYKSKLVEFHVRKTDSEQEKLKFLELLQENDFPIANNSNFKEFFHSFCVSVIK